MSFNLQNTLDELLKPPTHLQKLIDRACALERSRPDLSLNLEICDYVNQKKANNPHEAVFSLLPYINSRSQKQALLGLTLLDNLVKNCGHAVHFQIASKDFLNNLVRRFPEFQPSIPNPIHNKILEMLQEWRFTLCENSRYKDDLHKIKDMYNLLKRKHWRFTPYREGNSAIMLGPQNTVKSQHELEKEDLEAMQAKLQELLRRATPHDLREANKLMKVITGYERPSKKFDYDKQFSDELDALETKAQLLKDIIMNMDEGDKLDETGQELAAACISNINKIRQMSNDYKDALDDLDINESSEDSEEFFIYTRLSGLHELLVQVVKAVNDIERGIPPTFADSSNAETSLIMLGDDNDNGDSVNFSRENSQNQQNTDFLSPNPQPHSQTVPKKKNILNDLLDLDFTSASTGNSTPILSDISSPNFSNLIANSPSTTAGTTVQKPNYNVVLDQNFSSGPGSGASATQQLSGLSLGPGNSQLKFDFSQQSNHAHAQSLASKQQDLFDFGNILKTETQTPTIATSAPKPSLGSGSGSGLGSATATVATNGATFSDACSNRKLNGNLIDLL